MPDLFLDRQEEGGGIGSICARLQPNLEHIVRLVFSLICFPLTACRLSPATRHPITHTERPPNSVWPKEA